MDINILKDSKLWSNGDYDHDERFILLLSSNYAYGEFTPVKAPQLEDYWKESADLEEYYSRIFDDESLKMSQLYAKASKKSKDGRHWYRVREMAGKSSIYKTESDVGSVKVKIGNSSILISNGYGDGTTRVVIVPNSLDFNDLMLMHGSYITLDGEFSICSYDCGEHTIVDLKGRYRVYSYDGFVFFVKF